MKLSFMGLDGAEKAVAARAAGEAIEFVSSFSRMKPKTSRLRMRFVADDMWGSRRGGKNLDGDKNKFGEARLNLALVRVGKSRWPGELETIAVHEFAHINDTGSDAIFCKARRQYKREEKHLNAVKERLGFFSRKFGKGKEAVRKAEERLEKRAENYCIAKAITEGWATLVETGYWKRIGMEEEYRKYVDTSATYALEADGGGIQYFDKYLHGFNFYYQLEKMVGRAAAYLLPRFFPPKSLEELNHPDYYIFALKNEIGEQEFLRIVNRAAKVKFEA